MNNFFTNDVNAGSFRMNLVRNETRVIDIGNGAILEYKEAFFIKERTPILNNGLKASKELQPF